MAYNDKRPPLENFLTERGMRSPEVDPRQLRDEERQEALRSRGAAIEQWRAYLPTVTPATDLTNLTYARETYGLSVGDVADIIGQSPNTVEAAENGKATIADDALKAFVGGVLAAIVEHGR